MGTKYQYHRKYIILFYFIFSASCITILLTTNIHLVLILFGYLLNAEFEVFKNEQLLRVVPAKEYVNTNDCYAFLFISDLSNAPIAVIWTFTLNNIHKHCCVFCIDEQQGCCHNLYLIQIKQKDGVF